MGEEIQETGEIDESLDTEGADSFDEALDREGGKEKEVDTSGEEEKEEPGEEDDTNEEGAEESEGGEEKGEGEETAEQRALKRAEKFKEDTDKGGDEDKGKGDQDKGDDDKGGSPTALTKEQVKGYLEAISDADLPGEIVIGNKTVNLKGMQEEYPDDFNAIMVLGGMVAEKAVEKRLADAGYVKAEDVEKAVTPIQQQMQTLSFWDEVRDSHPDAKSIAKSGDFKAWLGKQSKSIQALASTWDADDAISVMDFYKESKAKKKAEDHDNKQRENKQKRDGLHSSGVRSKPSTQKSDSRNDMNDAEAAFNEATGQG